MESLIFNCSLLSSCDVWILSYINVEGIMALYMMCYPTAATCAHQCYNYIKFTLFSFQIKISPSQPFKHQSRSHDFHGHVMVYTQVSWPISSWLKCCGNFLVHLQNNIPKGSLTVDAIVELIEVACLLTCAVFINLCRVY